MKSKLYHTKVILFLLSSSLSMIFFSCKPETDDIPYAYVDFTIDLNDPQFHELKNISGYVYLTGGVNGIIVYRKSTDEFTAFERTCPHDPKCGKVYVNESLSAVDTVCCGSEFSLLIDGGIMKGESKFPLRQYTTTYSSNLKSLRITN